MVIAIDSQGPRSWVGSTASAMAENSMSLNRTAIIPQRMLATTRMTLAGSANTIVPSEDVLFIDMDAELEAVYRRYKGSDMLFGVGSCGCSTNQRSLFLGRADLADKENGERTSGLTIIDTTFIKTSFLSSQPWLPHWEGIYLQV